MTVIYCKETTLGPFFIIRWFSVYWSAHIYHYTYSIFVIISWHALMCVCCVTCNKTMCFLSKSGFLEILKRIDFIGSLGILNGCIEAQVWSYNATRIFLVLFCVELFNYLNNFISWLKLRSCRLVFSIKFYHTLWIRQWYFFTLITKAFILTQLIQLFRF